MKSEEHMSSYIARAKVAATNLRDAGIEVKDEDLAYAMLTGVPDSYENLNMVLVSLPDDKFTAEVKRVLLAEHDRRQSKLDDKMDLPKKALIANKEVEDKRTKTACNEKNKSIICYSCGKAGHFAKDCRSKKDKVYAKNLA